MTNKYCSSLSSNGVLSVKLAERAAHRYQRRFPGGVSAPKLFSHGVADFPVKGTQLNCKVPAGKVYQYSRPNNAHAFQSSYEDCQSSYTLVLVVVIGTLYKELFICWARMISCIPLVPKVICSVFPSHSPSHMYPQT
eukprot:2562081-Amphidinium_carterae.1